MKCCIAELERLVEFSLLRFTIAIFMNESFRQVVDRLKKLSLPWSYRCGGDVHASEVRGHESMKLSGQKTSVFGTHKK